MEKFSKDEILAKLRIYLDKLPDREKFLHMVHKLATKFVYYELYPSGKYDPEILSKDKIAQLIFEEFEKNPHNVEEIRIQKRNEVVKKEPQPETPPCRTNHKKHVVHVPGENYGKFWWQR